MADLAYEVDHPEMRSTSVVFASPHSGAVYTDSFLRQSILDETLIRSSEDAFVDRLFASATDAGAPLLKAHAPRAYVDLNRGPDELDPGVVAGVRAVVHNPRISSGLGVIPRVVANGRAIYRGKIDKAEAKSRIADVWHPYHTALQDLLNQSKSTFGEAILIDCHSMPREAIEATTASSKRRPAVVLGDRFGAACDPEIVDRVEAAFGQTGLRVSRNAPFAGAYVTQHYGRPSRRQHCIQVEIDRSLYMDEAAVRPHEGFADFCELLAGVVAEIAEIGRSASMTLAAE